jgi:hypothetical protein
VSIFFGLTFLDITISFQTTIHEIILEDNFLALETLTLHMRFRESSDPVIGFQLVVN